MPSGSKPGERRGGRKKGVPNKLTGLAKENIEKCGEALGGWKRMEAWARSDPLNERVYWSQIYTKLLPLQVNAELSGGITLMINSADEDL